MKGLRPAGYIRDEISHLDLAKTSSKTSNWAIVAIPEPNDYTWRISSEKVPHLTILFLGKQSSPVVAQQMADFLEHVAGTSLTRFGLQVDERGVLGEEEADVLFFSKKYMTKRLMEVRSYLLTNPQIYQAYNSAPQHPSWTPHLTMGYPETPARPDLREYPGFSWVEFDRVALWTGDYEGPEFQLKRDDGEEMSMSEASSDFLAHYGVKGMKWGVRKSEASGGGSSSASSPNRQERKAAKKLAKAETNWEKSTLKPSSFIQVHNAAARRMNDTEIDRINNKSQYRNKDFSEDSPLRRKYYKEYEDTFTRIMNEEGRRILGDSPMGNRRVKFDTNDDGGFDIRWEDVKHDDELPSFTVKIDSNGRIVSFIVVNREMEQSAIFLAHYGVKGMKWGVRKDRSGSSSSGSASTRTYRDSADAEAAKNTLGKIHGDQGRTDSLSNKELKSLIERMNLERQYSNLSAHPNQIQNGQNYFDTAMKMGQNVNKAIAFSKSPAGKILIKLLKTQFASINLAMKVGKAGKAGVDLVRQ